MIRDSAEAVNAARLLLAPGSSLGGARAKASVRDRDGALAIAKFPERKDALDAVRWEGVMLTLAERAGITVPKARIEMVGDTPVLLRPTLRPRRKYPGAILVRDEPA